jgi:gluconolactonase
MKLLPLRAAPLSRGHLWITKGDMMGLGSPRSRIAGLALALLIVAAAPANSQSTPSVEAPSKIPVLTRAQIDDALAHLDKVLFIDVRRPDEVSDIGGFPAYFSIQISELDRLAPILPHDRDLIVVSNHAARGAKGAELLAAKGFHVIGAVGAETYEKDGGAISNKKVVTPDIPGVVKAGTLVALVHEGFAGAEGPAVLKDGSIIFAEQKTNRIIRIANDGTVSTLVENDGGTHRLALTPAGDIWAANTGEGSVGIAILSPTRRVVANGLAKGKPFIHPNDLAISSSGNIYVTDPGAYQQAVRRPTPASPAELATVKTGVYRIDPKGKVSLVTDSIPWPNGIVLSPDEKTAYVANTVGDSLIAFDLTPDGSLANRRDFGKLAGYKPSPTGGRGADGIAIDGEGRVYATTSAGVEVFDASGKALGVIALPRAPQALVFGGADRSRLYVLARGAVYRIPTLTKGPDRLGK